MSNEDKKLGLARKYIAQGKGTVARPILESIAHLPEAQDLLLTLESLPIPAKKKNSSMLSVILLSLAICSLCYFFTRPSEDGEETAQATATLRAAGPVERPTARPTESYDELIVQIIKASLWTNGFEVDVDLEGRTLVVRAPSKNSAYEGAEEYVTGLGAMVAGATAGGFENTEYDVKAPLMIRMEFIENGQTLVEISFTYTNAVKIANEAITWQEFVGTWGVETIEGGS